MAHAGIGSEVEGIHAVLAAVHSGRVQTLFVEKGRQEPLEDLVDDARSAGATVRVVDDLTGLANTTAPQGVVAHATPISPISLFEAVSMSDPTALIMLDHVTDPRNLGAVARSAWAAGIPALVINTRRAAPVSSAAFKAAAGALEVVRICEVSSTPESITRLSKDGIWSVGLSADSSQSLFGLALLTEPVAIVLGAEGEGLARLVAERVDVLASIPMAAGVESLNVSVAAALASFEIGRVRGQM